MILNKKKKQKREKIIMSSRINLEDLIGKKYNKLTILDAWRDKKSQIIVKCQCECGNIKNILYKSLQTNQTTSCGCSQKINLNNLIGKKYGKLTILEAWRNSKSKIIVKAQCECGIVKNYMFDSLQNGNTKSCGCIYQRINLDDLIGKKYGRLTILEAWRNDKSKRMVKAQCECGIVKNYMFDSLQNGNTKSCGCIHQKIDLDDLIGKKYGRLTILQAWRDKESQILVKCQCECGKIKEYKYASLQNGNTQSCGCLYDKYINIYKQNAPYLYKIWHSMKQRCYNPNNSAYKYYGARGIIICNEWLNGFDNFYIWSMSHGYKNDLTIDRINVNGNYEPSNCRWITQKEQANNRNNNHYITINNETKTIKQWCEQYNINYDTVISRINRLKWDPLKALTTPIRKKYQNNTNNKQRLHKIWNGMKQRCYNCNNAIYKYYGARNITICNEWLNSFDNFYTWSINHGYKNDLTIDRIDTNGNYEPSNCRWATTTKQANNKSNNHYITIHNETKTLSEWCKQYNIKYNTVQNRINQLHWDPIKALTTSIKSHKRKSISNIAILNKLDKN